MKKTFFTLCIALSTTFSCYAQITEVNDMNDVFEYFKDSDSMTLAIFDVDMVLIQPSDPAFQMANMKRFSPICKRILNDVPKDKQMMFLGLMTISSDPVLIDDKIPHLLNHIIHKGIQTMAMTSNLTGKFGSIDKMEQWRIDNLRKLGIDFSKSAPCQANLVFDELATYRGNYSTYLHGVLFVNGTTVSKGEAFLSFIRKTGFYPNRVIFVDDREDNLKSVEVAIQQLERNIEFQGIHFLGAQKYPSKKISEEQFESSWQKLALEAKTID